MGVGVRTLSGISAGQLASLQVIYSCVTLGELVNLCNHVAFSVHWK